MEVRNQPSRSGLPNSPQTSAPTQVQTKTPLSAAAAVLPLRLFLAFSFLAAGWDKLTDPEFFDSKAAGYLGNQLTGFAQAGSPIGGLLTNVVAPNAVLFGAFILASEFAIGLGTLVGLLSRVAAFGGLMLSLTLWLSTTWTVSPFFLGADLPYAAGWLVLLVAGPHPVWSLDGQLQKWLSQRRAGAEANTQTQASNPSPAAYPPYGAAGYAAYGPDNQVYPPNLAEADAAPNGSPLARRRFLTVAGATMAAGVVTTVAWANSLSKRTSASSTANAGVSATQPVTATTAQPATTAAPTAGATTSSATTQATTQPATSTTTATVSGPVLAALSAIQVGTTRTVSIPGGTEQALLIHNTDGSVTALSPVCTHQGCDVVYQQANNALVCPCHGSRFDPKTGEAKRGPAQLPLKSYTVKVDGQGNIVYVQA